MARLMEHSFYYFKVEVGLGVDWVDEGGLFIVD
jgi:hypothetical protein